MNTMTLGEMLAHDEAKALETARAKIASENKRYETDPVYRSAIDAARKKKNEEFEALLSANPGCEEEDEEEDDL